MNIAVIPVLDSRLLTGVLAGKTMLDTLVGKLVDIRELDRVVLFCSPNIVSKIRLKFDRPWDARPLKNDAPVSLLRLRQMVEAPLSADNYLLCSPDFPFVRPERYQLGLLGLAEKTAMVSASKNHFSYAPQCSASFFRFAPWLLDACVGVRGDVEIRKNEMWHLGEAIGYIPLTDTEMVNVSTPEGLRLAEALVMCGEV
jgi:hypothetical protein